MAGKFPSSSGHGNFPNGNAFPQIWVDELIENFKESLVASDITNTKYEGEIADSGDTVRILKESVVNVTDYARGGIIPDQDFDDEEVQLEITEGKAFSFKLDDVEKRLSHVDWASKQSTRAMFDLKKAVDTDILEVMRDNGTAFAETGISGTPVTVGYGGSVDFTPINYLNRLMRLLDENDVPSDSRFYAVTPRFFESLRSEEGSLIDTSVTGKESALSSPNALGTIYGVPLYQTTNMPLSAGGDTLVMAGHMDSTSTATALIKTKVQDVEKSFQERFMGVVAYGRKVIRPEALIIGNVTFSG